MWKSLCMVVEGKIFIKKIINMHDMYEWKRMHCQTTNTDIEYRYTYITWEYRPWISHVKNLYSMKQISIQCFDNS